MRLSLSGEKPLFKPNTFREPARWLLGKVGLPGRGGATVLNSGCFLSVAARRLMPTDSGDDCCDKVT